MKIKTTSRFLILLLALLVSTPILYSQPQRNGTAAKPAGVVKGKVLDDETKKPLMRATVTLHNPSNDKQITGAYTDKNGLFTLNANPGDYYLKIHFVGYDQIIIPNISITPTNLIHEINTVSLKMNAIMTKGVEVTAQREAIEVGLDRKVFNIEQDVTSLGGSAIDVLANIPSVTVDQDDNVSLRGSSNVKIMIDGRVSNLSASEALQQIPATMISSVELITNPGARYEADGTAGMINIVTTRQRDDGFNAMFNLNSGFDDDFKGKYNGSVSMNYNIGKLNIFSNVSARIGGRSGSNTSRRTLWNADGVPSYVLEESESDRGGNFEGLKIGADYSFSTSDILTYSYRVNFMKRTSDNYSDYTASDYLFNTTNYYERKEKNDPPYGTNQEHTLSYTHRFEQKGHELYADLFYTKFDRGGSSYYDQYNFIAPDFVQSVLAQQQNYSSMVNDGWTAQVDYARPIGTNFKLELGGKYSNRLSDIDNHLDDLVDGDWVVNPWSSDQFEYDENIFAVYATGSSKFGNLAYNVGVRSETTVIDFNSLRDPNVSFNDDYTLFFPSAYLTYEINPNISLNGNFATRMRRPNYWNLNPVTNYEDPLNLRKGNPRLRPEHHYIFELGYLMNYDAWTFTGTLFYRYSTDGIQMYKEIYNGDTTLTMPHNISKSAQTGLDIIGMYKFTDWWKIDGSWSLYNSSVDASNIGGNDRDATSWNARINSTINYDKWLDWTLTWGYRSKMLTAQGEMKSSWNLDASFRFTLSKALSLSLRVQDIFNTRQWNMWESIPGVLYSERESKMNSRSVFVGITYKLNNFKQKRDRTSDGDDRLQESE
ncbi:MAG: TonB-dependent receptor family protein [Ignavibacteria bacterium]|nr:TonB-dependent receptor family protein [Ignavibacteria bacterium]